MSEIIKIGEFEDTFESSSRVYSCIGISPTMQVSMGTGGGNVPLFMEILKMVRTEEGKRLRKAYDSGEIHHGFNEYREPEPRTDGLSNTVTTVSKDNYMLEVKQATKQGYALCEIGGVADLEYPQSQTRRGRVIENGKISPTLTTESIPNVLESWVYEIDGEMYLIRIRKLTPLECWRLMGFSDEDFSKAAKVNSNTQLYKQAGNSIVKPVLMSIFSQLFSHDERIEYMKNCVIDLLNTIGDTV